jgi:hypothetical protein
MGLEGEGKEKGSTLVSMVTLVIALGSWVV